jgi:hypothetical protein
MNDFLVDKKEEMRNYLLSITDREFSSAVNREEIKQVHESDINLDKYEQSDLVKLHKLFMESAKDIVAFFLTDGAKQVRPIGPVMNDCFKVVELARELGIEPADEAHIIESMSTAIYRIKERVDNSLLESRFFMYRGKRSRDRRPVFYLIASRLGEDLSNEHFGQFLFTIIKTLGKIVESMEWCLVLDMTFVCLNAHHKQIISTLFEKIAPFINSSIVKNLQQLFVVHASNFKTSLFDVLKAGFKTFSPSAPSKESAKKIIECQSWIQLHEYIRPAFVLLPEESKAFLPDSFKVVKINPKGKHQERIIKLTPKSILNIDPKNNTIRNERLLADIEEVSAPQSNLEVHMKFRPSNTKGPLSPFFSSNVEHDISPETNYHHLDDAVFRRYIVASENERSDLLEELFETTVQSQFIDTVQAFQLNETTFSTDDESSDHRTARKTERVYKFTNDSILVVDKRTIKSELPFIAVEYVKVLNNDLRDTAHLKMKHEEHERVLLCEGRAKQIEDSVNDGLKRAIERVRMRSLAEPESDGEGAEEEELDEQRGPDDFTEDPNGQENEEAIPQEFKAE